jgi:hypothetical protein
MNAEAPGARPLVAFRGPVSVRRGHGAATLLLRGHEATAPDRRGRDPIELAFAAADVGALPALLRDVRVFGPEPGQPGSTGRQRFRIEAALEAGASGRDAWSAEVLARGAQLHREAGRAFFGAVRPPSLPLTRRCGWFVLLWVLRLPGAARLVERLRGRT